MKLQLAAQPPFSLSSVINSHGWGKLTPFHLDEGNDGFTYIYWSKNNQVFKLDIQEISEGVVVHIPGNVEQNDLDCITADIIWMLVLDEDFSEFYRLAKQEPKLNQVEDKAQGRLLRSPTLFEDTIKTILTTNTSWGGTIRMNDSLVSQFGDPLPGSTTEFAFPTPQVIASSDEQTLREITRLGYRAPYILNLAREIDSGILDLESLKTSDLSGDQLHKKLTSIKGVGNYAAANLLMLLGHYEYLTIDSWAIKIVSKEFFNGNPISPADVESVFKPWGKWKGLAYWLWNWSSD